MTMIVSEIAVETHGVVAVDGARTSEVVRYFLASVAALTLDASLLWFGVTRLALPAWFAGAIAYAAGLVLIYVLSVRWVFARRTVTDSRNEFMIFAALGLVGMALNSATLYVATSAGLALPLAKGISAAIGFVSNFISRKAILFTQRAS